MAKVISLWSCEAGTGRRTVAKGLADTWAAAGRPTLLIDIGHSGSTPPPENWIPRFRSLSPNLLRNFLAGPPGSYAELSLAQWPEPAIMAQMLQLTRRAFDWSIILDPATSPSIGTLALLDASDLLLWISKSASTLQQDYQSFLTTLNPFHYPHAYVQPVLNRVITDGHPEAVPGKRVLATLEEDRAGGYRLWKGIRELAGLLGSREELYKPQEPASPQVADAPIVEHIKQKVQPELLKILEGNAVLEADAAQKTVEACLAEDASLPSSREIRSEILTRVLEEVLGLGPLEPLLKDPAISEIMVNGHECIFVEKSGKLHEINIHFTSEKQLRTVIDRIVAPLGRRVDESMPLCDARLADGSRVNIVLPPLALNGPVVTIRKFSNRKLDLGDLVRLGSISQVMGDFLERSVRERRNIVVAGGTGSGKTTLLNALSSAIPSDERIVTIEDAAELKLQKPHVVRLESRPANAEGQGAIPIRQLVINALRMRPDRIVVGECRGGEALDMLQAMNTGHDGSLTTVHANSPRDALGRLETLVLMAGMDLPVRVVREQIRSAVHVLVQQTRLGDGLRKVTSITEITGMEGDTLTTQELFRFRGGIFESTGLVPKGGPR